MGDELGVMELGVMEFGVMELSVRELKGVSGHGGAFFGATREGQRPRCPRCVFEVPTKSRMATTVSTGRFGDSSLGKNSVQQTLRESAVAMMGNGGRTPYWS